MTADPGVPMINKTAITCKTDEAFGSLCVRLQERFVPFSLAGFRTLVITGSPPQAVAAQIWLALLENVMADQEPVEIRRMERGQGPSLVSREETERRLREMTEEGGTERKWPALRESTIQDALRRVQQMDKQQTVVEAVVHAMKGDDYGESGGGGLYLYKESSIRGERSRYFKLDLGDEVLKRFRIGQKVRVTVEAVEE